MAKLPLILKDIPEILLQHCIQAKPYACPVAVKEFERLRLNMTEKIRAHIGLDSDTAGVTVVCNKICQQGFDYICNDQKAHDRKERLEGVVRKKIFKRIVRYIWK